MEIYVYVISILYVNPLEARAKVICVNMQNKTIKKYKEKHPTFSELVQGFDY
jgi:hypothetical protein